MKRPSVLIVEDVKDVHKALPQMLKNEIPECQVFEASNVNEGLNKISRMKYDLVITDLSLPKIDGIGFVLQTQSMPSAFRPRKFILVSTAANADPSKIPSYIGEISYLQKPINESLFCTLVRDLLGIKKADLEAESNLITTAAPDFDVTFVNPFIESTLEVFSVMANTKAKKDKVYLRTTDQVRGDLSAVIPMNSDDYLGSMAITFQEKCILRLVENMLGESYQSLNVDVQDAAGELCNQIMGGAKRILNVIRFNTEAGQFCVECVTQRLEKQKPQSN